MLTAGLSFEAKSVGELVKLIDLSDKNYVDPDVYEKIVPFRIFRIKDLHSEPVPIFGSEAWINSTEIFPKRFEIERTLYESDHIKVKLCKNIETNEQVRRNKIVVRVIY